MSISASSQRGIALLTILLLVVSITVVAGAMLASQKIVIRRSSLLFNQDQLLQDIDAAKQIAVTMLRTDSKLNNTDSLQDIWAQPIPPYTFGRHLLSIEIRDEASRFNLNNLYHDSKVDAASLSVFQRLLTQLNIDPEIAIAVLDWQDADSEVYNDGGSESTVYSQQGRTADNLLPNQPFVSIEQLQEVRGVDEEVFATLKPYITAAPYYLPINVNTASPELLASLVDGVSVAQLQGLGALRGQQVVETIDSLWQQPPLSALSVEQRQAVTPLIAVDSQAFMALITATDNTDTSNTRQRFATVLISKSKDESGAGTSSNNANASSNTDNANSNNATANNNNDNESQNNTKQAKTVKIVAQRLWAFEPNL